jgi:hypothetical protein
MSNNNVRPITPGSIVHAGANSAVVDRFAQVIEVAQPTLDAIVKLREAGDWLAKWRNYDPSYNRLMLDPNRLIDEDEANARLAIIPEMTVLQDAARLFDDAVRKAAPEPWFFLAIGAMLLAMPNAKNVAPDYSLGIVDMLVHDHESWERDCQPGFSAPVFICAIRQVRREQEFVPSAAAILKACKEHRARFRRLESEVTLLIHVRENAEEHLRVFDYVWTEEDEVQRQKVLLQKKQEGYVYVEIPDKDLPF